MTTDSSSWDEVTYPNFTNRSAADIAEWDDDPHWPQRYTVYAEALRLAAEVKYVIDTEGVSEANDILEQLGDPARPIWHNLDTSKRSQAEQGRFLMDEVLMPSINELMGDFRPGVSDDAPILAWPIALSSMSRNRRLAMYEDLTGEAFDGDINIWIRRVGWPDGLSELEQRSREGDPVPSLAPSSVPGLRRITLAIASKLKSEERTDAIFDWQAPFDGLLPFDIAEVLRKRTLKLKTYRDKLRAAGQPVSGIDENGFTDLWRMGLPFLNSLLSARQSMLLIGPTTTGKTDFSRIAASHTIWLKKKVIVLLPTKALVSQAAKEWRTFFEEADSSRTWRLLEASRDHPYNDEDIARGDYDIVLAIPEKLAAYLSGGSRILDQCGLLVVDELQTLNQRQRGANIESLLTIIKARYPNLPILGLSATLTRASSESVRTWLNVGSTPSEGFIVTSERPVTLDRVASDMQRSRRRRQDGTIEDAPWGSDLMGSELNNLLKASGLSRVAHRDAVALACHLLQRPDAIADSKSILIFVGSRRAAELITEGIQAALDFLEVGQSASWRSPHFGRFGQLMMTEDQAEIRDRDFFELPNLPATEDVREGLGSGVMYHNARLDPEHRRIIEGAFTDKVIRVLVATATLAVGINLPADFVIVADLTEGTSLFSGDQAVERLLDPHDIAQRFGRCGRLGMSSKGEAYVLAQRNSNRARALQLTDDQIAFFKTRIPPEDRHSDLAVEIAVSSELATVDGVFDYFVMSDDTGEPVTTNLDDRGFARLLLQDMCKDTAALSREAIDILVGQIYENSLLKVEGSPLPKSFDLLDILDSAKLIGPAPEDPKRFKVTGLGRTVALSNVPLANSRGIREVAEAALLGAGALTLLTIAAQADYVRDLTWLRLPHEQNSDLLDRVRERIWAVVRAFASEGRDLAERFETPEFLELVSSEAGLVGHGQPAQALRGRVELEPARLSDATLVAHFRACIALLWLRGFQMNSLITFIEQNTKATVRGRTRSFEAYPADIRDLGERVSYVLNAAAEVVRISPDNGRYLDLKNMAESVQSGIPFQLAPIMRLRAPRIHRERLAALLDMREAELDFDNLRGVLETLSTPRTDRSAQQKRAHTNLGFSEEEISAILTQLSRGPLRVGARALPPETRDQKIPSRSDVEGSTSYGRIANDMARKKSMSGRSDEIIHVLEEFGLRVEAVTSGDAATLTLRRMGSDDEVIVHLLFHRLDKALLLQYVDQRCCLVLMEGMSAGAEYELRLRGSGGPSAMTIWVFISALARVDRSWRAYSGVDPDIELARRAMLFFATAVGPVGLSDVSLAEVAAGLPAPPPLFLS